MGYSDAQLRDLEATINAVECDAVIAGTPIDLGRIIDSRHPIREVTYTLEDLGTPRLTDVLAPIVARRAALRR
jgi:predicted GTPase